MIYFLFVFISMNAPTKEGKKTEIAGKMMEKTKTKYVGKMNEMNDQGKMKEQINRNVEERPNKKTESWKRQVLKQSRNRHRIRDLKHGKKKTKQSRNRRIKKKKNRNRHIGKNAKAVDEKNTAKSDTNIIVRHKLF